MINVRIQIRLSADDPTQLGAQLAAILQGAQALADIEIDPTTKNGAVAIETDVRGGNTHAAPPTPNDAPATPATQPKKRGRPRKTQSELLDPKTDWPAFDDLVRSEMERLSVDGRMPSTAVWNSNRDVQLPTMTHILEAYDVLNLLTLAAKLELRPPVSALGVQPFVSTNGEAQP